MNRREFLRIAGATGLSLPLVSRFGIASGFIPESQTLMNNDRVLVVVRLFGGNDGLNTIIPFKDDRYYSLRQAQSGFTLAIPENEILHIPDQPNLGFHSSLEKWLELYNEKKLLAVQNVGYPNQDLSHFRSIDIWLSASDADVYEESGWLGRYAEYVADTAPTTLTDAPFALEFATNISRILRTKKDPLTLSCQAITSLPDLPTTDFYDDGQALRVEDAYIREIFKYSRTYLSRVSQYEKNAPENTVAYPQYEATFAANLSRTARLIASGLETKVYVMTTGMFDFHQYQLQYQKDELRTISETLYAFQRDLENLGIADRVTTLIFSEFGRRVQPNGGGSDHGGAAPVFLMGTNLKGGIHGSMPDLGNLVDGNLPFHTDFRQIYASILYQWFRMPIADIAPSILTHGFQQLPLFQLGNTENVQGLHVQCMPNPATDFTNILAVNFPESESAKLTITDMRGVEVLSFTAQSAVPYWNIDLRRLGNGYYFCSVEMGRFKATAPLLVLRS